MIMKMTHVTQKPDIMILKTMNSQDIHLTTQDYTWANQLTHRK